MARIQKVGLISRSKDITGKSSEKEVEKKVAWHRRRTSHVISLNGCSRKTAPACLQNSRVVVMEVDMFAALAVLFLKVHSFLSFQISDRISTIIVLVPFLYSGLALLIILEMISLVDLL